MDFKLLKILSETPGVSGYEEPIRDFIMTEIDGLNNRDGIGVKYPVFEQSIDRMGNLTIHATNSNYVKTETKVMLAAHMDEIGFAVSDIDDKGFITFQPLGGFDPKTVVCTKVVVHGMKDIRGVIGTKPIHTMSAAERKAPPDMDKFFIDTGLSKKKLEKIVSIGDPISRLETCEKMGKLITGKSMDNRFAVYTMLKMLEKLSLETSNELDIYAVFTTQEEVGLRGATAAALEIKPHFSIVLDVTIGDDIRGDKNRIKLGEGTVVKMMDGSAIFNPRFSQFIIGLAKDNKIKYQVDYRAAGGTDAGAVQKFCPGGSITGGIAVGTRYVHQNIETLHPDDVDASVELLCLAIDNLKNFKLS